jgi:hypothetical protein
MVVEKPSYWSHHHLSSPRSLEWREGGGGFKCFKTMSIVFCYVECYKSQSSLHVCQNIFKSGVAVECMTFTSLGVLRPFGWIIVSFKLFNSLAFLFIVRKRFSADTKPMNGKRVVD